MAVADEEAEGERAPVDRPFARIFDLILSEYGGYTDETILDLSLARIRQMTDVIIDRRNRELRARVELELNMLQMATTAIVAALANVPQDSKSRKSIAHMAKSLSFTKNLPWNKGKETKELPSTESVLKAFGVRHDGQVSAR